MKLLFWLWVILSIALIALATDRLYGESTKHISNGLGVPEYTSNPWSYILALPLDGEVLDGKYTNVRISPYGTPELFDQSLLFCGDVTENLTGKEGPMVFVYRTQASRVYQGVACYELKAIFEVPTK